MLASTYIHLKSKAESVSLDLLEVIYSRPENIMSNILVRVQRGIEDFPNHKRHVPSALLLHPLTKAFRMTTFPSV